MAKQGRKAKINQDTFNWKSGINWIYKFKIYQIGIFFFLLVNIMGYLDFRNQGEGLYNEGQSGFSALPKGMDFKCVYDWGIALRSGLSNYVKMPGLYPPFVTVAFLPLTFFSLYNAYKIYCILQIIFLFTLIYALLGEKSNGYFSQKAYSSDKILLTTVGLIILFHSYPVNFALERGNSDIIAAAFAVLSLLAMRRGSLLGSTIFLAISSQIKLYPAILVVLLIIRFGWKGVGLFGLFNLCLLLVLGVPGLEKLLTWISWASSTTHVYTGCHSMSTFLFYINDTKLFVMSNFQKTLILNSIFFIMLGFLVLVAYRTFKTNKQILKNISQRSYLKQFSGAEIGIIGMSFCLMSFIPAVSNDYKLIIHIIPLILLFSRSWTELFSSRATAYIITIIVTIAISYLFIPRFTILPLRLLGLMSPLTEMKTPALIIAFLGYGYLALKGNPVIALVSKK